MTLLERGLAEAKKRGMTRADFAREVVECGPTKLWQLTTGARPLKDREARRIKEWLWSLR